MPAFTTIFAGISALSGLKGVNDAKKAQKQQATANAKQDQDAKTIALEAGKLEAQDQGGAAADISLGTSKEDDDLLKKNSTGKGRSGTPIGGLKGSATNIGGL